MPYGLTVPLSGMPLHAQRDLIASLPNLGFTDVWSAEAGGADAFTPLALASAWAPSLRLGTAIVPAFTRGAPTIAQSAAALADAAPGRVAIGIGSSSDVIVQRWNGIPFDKPYERVRDVVRFLRVALTGAKVTETYETFAVDSFRLLQVPEIPPKLLVAALRPGMLRLAGREADGAIINWLAATDVPTVARYVHEGGPDKEIVARIFVAPTEDAAAGPDDRPSGHCRVPQRAGVPQVPRVAGSVRCAWSDVDLLGSRRPARRHGRDPGRGGRRPRRARHAGRHPRPRPALR